MSFRVSYRCCAVHNPYAQHVLPFGGSQRAKHMPQATPRTTTVAQHTAPFTLPINTTMSIAAHRRQRQHQRRPRFAAAASTEMAREDAQTAAEAAHCRRETERLELAARLASLAATAEHRTRGSVVLRRLPPSHPQHARCLRAATQNVKPEFFSGESPYGAVKVLDIYKVRSDCFMLSIAHHSVPKYMERLNEMIVRNLSLDSGTEWYAL